MGPSAREIAIIVRAYDQVSGELAKTQRGITGFAAKASALLHKVSVAAAAAGAGILLLARHTSKNAADLAEQARALGVTTEALSRLRIAYDFVGDKAEDADAILAKLNKTLGEVAMGGGKEAENVLGQLGLSAEELIKLSPDEALLRIAEAFDTIDAAAKRSAVASVLFGRGVSQQFLRGLIDGSAELRKMVQNAEKFGNVLRDVDAQRLRELDDHFKSATAQIERAAQALTVKLAPAIEQVLGAFTILATLPEQIERVVTGTSGKDLEKAKLRVMDALRAAGKGPEYFQALDDYNRLLARSKESGLFIRGEPGVPQGPPKPPPDMEEQAREMDAYTKATQGAYQAFRTLMVEWSNFEAAAIDGAREIVDMGLNGVVDALTDAITGVKSLKDAFKELGRAVVTELIRIGIRLAIVAGLSALIPGAGPLLGITGKAKGGTMQGNMVPLGKYATGGIARGPQLALFGEGPGAEAFVPLPDGKTIPVTMRGGGRATVNITIQAIDTQSGVEWLLENRAAIGQIIAGEMAGSGALRSAVRSVA